MLRLRDLVVSRRDEISLGEEISLAEFGAYLERESQKERKEKIKNLKNRECWRQFRISREGKALSGKKENS